MVYKCINTAVGLELMTQAEATRTQIRLTHMAAGDGNGNPVTPNDGMTHLVREQYRADAPVTGYITIRDIADVARKLAIIFLTIKYFW